MPEGPDRMSALDAFFFYTEEDGRNHMHVGGFALADGTAPSAEEVAKALAPKIARIPRYTQLARPAPLHVNRPEWVPAPDFDITEHVRTVTAPEPGHDGLCRVVGDLISVQLDRARPLWEVVVIDGISDGPSDDQFAIFWKIHHSMVDGVSGTQLLTILFDDSPDGPTTELPPLPAGADVAPRSRLRSTTDAVTGLGKEAVGRVRSLRPSTVTKAARVGAAGLALTRRNLMPDLRSPLTGPIGPTRSFDFCAIPFADVKTVRGAFGGTVNDVVLTIVLDGFRELLESRGLEVKGKHLRLMNPVALRERDAEGRPLGDGTMETKASALMPRLPLDVDDPVTRLEFVRGHLAELKQTAQADAVSAMNEIQAVLPGTLNAIYLRASSAMPQRSLQTTVTNVHGPTIPLYLLGRPLRRIANYAPPFPVGARSSITVYSYNGELVFGITTDRESLPDVDRIAAGIQRSMDELLERAAVLNT
ncbi:wax ester/triacylglycerol synthase family O-acyltransferase [Sporichthya polymorpha]|uniref:wax ester/triacylglycerol synthase family O-acyltransferase n=1 Tax=Sporichthya polymorpha TaxID=35751 RepID=UPI00036AC5D6|nr:wax ester/triacylglycerol synthase family O-acyltransferase [Sporichthya polymorpha]